MRDLLSQFEAKEIEGSPPPPSWNVAPTQDVPIIAERLDEDWAAAEISDSGICGFVYAARAGC